MEPREERASIRSLFTDGITIALITFSAYLTCLFYELGYCKYFGIPYDFVSINVNTVLALSWGLILLALLLFIISVIISSFFAMIYSYIRRGTFRMQNLSDSNSSILIIGIPIIILYWGAFGFTKIGEYVAKEQKEFSLFDTQNIPGVSKVAVVRVYGDNLLAVPIKREEKTFEKKLVILKLGEIKELLTFEKVGPLVPSK